MNVNYAIQTTLGIKRETVKLSLQVPLVNGVIRIDSSCGSFPDMEKLKAAAVNKFWKDMSVLVYSPETLNEPERRVLRYWVTECAQEDAIRDWAESRRVRELEEIQEACHNRYVLGNALLTEEQKQALIPSQYHWFALYYEHYQIWWRDCGLKTQPVGIFLVA